MKEFSHVSVLLNETIDGLNIRPKGIYVDGTTGGGGHSERILECLDGGRLICIDRDEDALAAAGKRLENSGDVTFVHDNFKNLRNVVNSLGIDRIDGCLFDLGVSSYQLDTRQRGFSYMERDASLDMRMDATDSMTAADVVNTYEEAELIRIFKEYGEERFSKKIAGRIVEERGKRPLKTTGDLTDIIERCVPKNQKGGHPAKRVFQALRIEVNDELGGLYDFLYELPKILNDGGRIAVITFHSLEDRITKQAFKKMSDPCICPKEFPVCTCGRKPMGKIITRKPILPGEEEMAGNSRSKSAKLRIFEKRSLEV